MKNHDLQECFGWAGVIFSLYSMIFPIFSFIDIIKGKIKFEDSPISEVSVYYLNYFIWYIYGNLLLSLQIKTASMIGIISSLISISIYLFYDFKKCGKHGILNFLILISGSYLIYTTLERLNYNDYRYTSFTCILTYLIVLIAPAETINAVINQKNYSFIQLYGCWFDFMSSTCWVVYGVLYEEYYIVFPHAINIILCMILLTLYLNYKKKCPLNLDEYSSVLEDDNNGKNQNINQIDETKVEE
jgi:solute carrier family 50 protein (sugar transporter)